METQKIIEQRLSGSEETAELEAKYTWKKDEIAWYYCNTFKDVFKVQFTGKNWLIGNKWGRSKIYQYKHLDDHSGDHDIAREGLDHDGISHSNENNFYTTKEAVVHEALRHIEAIKDYALKEYEEDKEKIKKFANIKK